MERKSQIAYGYLGFLLFACIEYELCLDKLR